MSRLRTARAGSRPSSRAYRSTQARPHGISAMRMKFMAPKWAHRSLVMTRSPKLITIVMTWVIV